MARQLAGKSKTLYWSVGALFIVVSLYELFIYGEPLATLVDESYRLYWTPVAFAFLGPGIFEVWRARKAHPPA